MSEIDRLILNLGIIYDYAIVHKIPSERIALAYHAALSIKSRMQSYE